MKATFSACVFIMHAVTNPALISNFPLILSKYAPLLACYENIDEYISSVRAIKEHIAAEGGKGVSNSNCVRATSVVEFQSQARGFTIIMHVHQTTHACML